MPETMVEATINEVSRNPETGWFKIKTSRGTYDTKIPEKAAEAVALQGETTRLFYSEGRASGNINPHTGQPFPPSRYYERAERIAAAAVLSNGGAIPGVVETGRRSMPKDEVWRICLSVGVKAAVDTLALMPAEQRDFDTQKTIALAWGRFLFFTQAPDLPSTQMPLPPDPESRVPGEQIMPPPFAGQNVLKSVNPGAGDPGPEAPPPVDDIPY